MTAQWTFCEAGCGRHFRFNSGQRFCQGRDCQSARFRRRIMGNAPGKAREEVEESLRAAELARLVEEQERVMAGWHEPQERSAHGASLDAEITDGITLHDVVATDEEHEWTA